MVLTLNLRHRGREAESECGCEEPSGEGIIHSEILPTISWPSLSRYYFSFPCLVFENISIYYFHGRCMCHNKELRWRQIHLTVDKTNGQ